MNNFERKGFWGAFLFMLHELTPFALLCVLFLLAVTALIHEEEAGE